MVDKSLLFEKLIMCIIIVGKGVLMNSREKAEASATYLPWCQYKNYTVITKCLTRNCICTN